MFSDSNHALISDSVYVSSLAVPTSILSANIALYKIIANGVLIDSFYLNQNEGGGNWKNIRRYFLPADIQILIKVIDTEQSTSGPVIVADAFKIALYEESTSADKDVISNTPNIFQLFQNYPNPFYPSTTIKYTIPSVISTEGRNLNVQLKIYDVLGNEVATLVDENKPAGSYEVNFDAGNLSNGVYFYKLQAGSFVQTKKMLLLK